MWRQWYSRFSAGNLLPSGSPLASIPPVTDGGTVNPGSIGQCAMQCSANTCFQERGLAPGNIRQCVRQCVQGCLGEVSPAPGQGFRTQSLPFESAPAEQGAINQCQNVLVSPEDVPAALRSFASPFDSAGLGALNMGIWCDANGVEANIGNGQPTTFVHQTAYLAKNKEAWQQVSLRGTPATQSLAGRQRPGDSAGATRRDQRQPPLSDRLSVFVEQG